MPHLPLFCIPLRWPDCWTALCRSASKRDLEHGGVMPVAMMQCSWASCSAVGQRQVPTCRPPAIGWWGGRGGWCWPGPGSANRACARSCNAATSGNRRKEHNVTQPFTHSHLPASFSALRLAVCCWVGLTLWWPDLRRKKPRRYDTRQHAAPLSSSTGSGNGPGARAAARWTGFQGAQARALTQRQPGGNWWQPLLQQAQAAAAGRAGLQSAQRRPRAHLLGAGGVRWRGALESGASSDLRVGGWGLGVGGWGWEIGGASGQRPVGSRHPNHSWKNIHHRSQHSPAISRCAGGASSRSLLVGPEPAAESKAACTIRRAGAGVCGLAEGAAHLGPQAAGGRCPGWLAGWLAGWAAGPCTAPAGASSVPPASAGKPSCSPSQPTACCKDAGA
jgi:hypothetical protein